MARRNVEQDSGTDKGGMRILYVELNGSNSSLQEGLRTLVAAMNKPVQVAASPSRRLLSNQNSTPANEPESEPNLFTQAAGASAPVDTPEKAEPDENESTRRRRGEGAIRDRNAALGIVNSLNLRPDGRDSLKEFVASKQPRSQIEHIAVYVYYLKNILEEPRVGYSHIYTCFNETGERMPGDVPQSCRNAANSKTAGWIDVSNSDDIVITTRGKNLVEKDLPPANSGDNGRAQ